jgi:coenzyme F420-0:L-glutamate ligase/coenzyme F420-1:gamma-L-glutamate ligase
VARPPGAGTARDLVRPAADDLFRTAGAPEELLAFLEGTGRPAAPLPDPVDPALVERAVEAAALAAPAPAPRLVRVATAAARERWLAATRPPDQAAPTLPGFGPAAGSAPAPDQDPGGPRRTAAAALAPVLLVPCLAGDGPADELAAGAFTQALLLALRAQGMATVWVPAVPSRRRAGAAALDLPAGWLPLGAVAAGRSGPDAAPPPAARPAPGLIDR